MRDRLGNWSYTVYNGIRKVTDAVDPLGRVIHYTYCGCGSPESVTTAYGTALALTTSHTYNNQGLLEQTTHPDGSVVVQYHDALGRVVKTTDYWGSTTNYFDNLGRLSVVQGTGGTVLDRTFDDDNRVTSQTGPENVVANMTYDVAGRLRTRSLTGGGTEAWGYTANIAGATSYTNQVSAVTTFAFDAAGRKTNEIVVGMSTNSFSYYGAGDLKTLTDAKGSVTQWKYNAEGQVAEKWYQGQSTADLVYLYSVAGQLTNRFTRTGTGASTNGYVTGYLFDAAGNLTNVVYASGTTSVALGYDALNRLTNMVDGVGTTAYSYAMLGNGLSTMTEDGPWASDEITVTNRGGLRGGLKITQPTAQYVVTNQYDGGKRLTTVGGTAGTFNYFYSTALPSGLPLGIALPGGPSITNRYDSLARLTSTELWTNTLLNLHGYQYNNAFQRTWASRTNSASSSWNGYQNLVYDPSGQLTNSWAYATDGTPVTSEKWSFGYDPAQNLLKRTNNTTVETFAVNALNQLSTIPSSTPTYDRPGNLMTRAFTASSWVYWNYTYDRENRLTSVATDTSFTPEQSRFKVEFTYDGQSRLRIKRDYSWSGGAWANAGETRYLYDGMLIVQERSSANAPTVTYTRGRDLSGSLSGAGGIGGLLARSSGYSSGTGAWSTHDFYHADGNGNITAMVNASGTLRGYYRYDPFGRQRAQGGALSAANVMRFSSKPWVVFNANISDGLYYYGYRFYDPYLQRWVNRDPIGEGGGMNIYAFVRNGPLKYIDANGHYTYGRKGQVACDGNGNWASFYPNGNPPPDQPCLEEHENQHLTDYNREYPGACQGVPKGQAPAVSDEFAKSTECNASNVGYDCLNRLLCDPRWSPADRQYLKHMRTGEEVGISTWCKPNPRNQIRVIPPGDVPPGWVIGS